MRKVELAALMRRTEAVERPRVMRRRAFLRRLALGGAALAAGCVNPPAASNPPTAATTATIAPTATATATPTPPDWSALRASLRGVLVRPADDGYDKARLLYNTRFDAIRPQAIARCASASDVRECVRFARDARVPVAVRSGGHSYGGWSTGTGLVIDVAGLAAIDVGAGRATVGAGAQLVDLYDTLAAHGAGIAAGSCPTVGIAGLTLGGGIGVLSRAWGLTCDQLVGAQIVTADAQVRDCDADREPDLFWALRGGGGGSFGVVTSLAFRTHPAADLAIGFLSWPYARAATVVAAWQRWMASAPDSLWSTLHLQTRARGADVTMHAVLTGGVFELVSQFNALVAGAGPPLDREEGVRSYRDVMLLEAGCLGRSAAECHLAGTTADGILRRETYAAKSAVARRPMSSEAVAALVDGVAALGARDDVGGGAVLIDALGGAVSRIPADATAFPHRDAFAVLQLIAGWDASAPAPLADATRTWLRDLYAKARPLIGRGAYANYADPDLDDWPEAYYDANYARLRQVKARYDPDRLFDFPQAVRP
ncbi:MAG TPA: FAD-binding oxidoreductase [Candidatus Limnocylindria bacterium]|nr:FAD-binding oxidoreductase [Candidatus Limnocylindria bacterium]